MKQTVKFGKARLIRLEAKCVYTWSTSSSAYRRAGVVGVRNA